MDRLDNLQVLRAAAAGAVLFGHVLAEAQHHFDVPLALSDWPWTRGVDLFFVLSGTIIALGLLHQRPTPAVFFAKRAARVVPLYYLFTTLMVLTVMFTPGTLKDTSFDPMQILSSYGFLPYARADGRIAPVLSLGWTLNYEMFFYALAALCLWAKRPLLMLTGILGLLPILAPLMPEHAITTSWTSPLLWEFVFGIGIAALWRRGLRLSAVLALGLAAAGVAWLVIGTAQGWPRWISAGGGAALLVAAATLGPRPRWPRILVRLGDASYALYLSHRFVLRPLTLGLVPLLPATPWAIAGFVVVACASALIVGVLIFTRLEVPLQSWLRDRRPIWRAA